MSETHKEKPLPTTIIDQAGNTYLLTVDHPDSSYGQPVLVDQNDKAYRPIDVVEVINPDLFGERCQRTASMIVANWCRSHMPDDFVHIDAKTLVFCGLTNTKTAIEKIAEIPLEGKN